jgi:hypothetical protein
LDVIKLTVSTGTESTLVLTTDYTVSLNGDQNSNPGGTVTLTAGALASGFTLTITSDIANLQPTDLTNQGGFYPEVITDSLDRATIQIQQIADIGDRTLKIPISDGTLNMELPTKTERANSFLSFDANGLPSVVTAGSSGAPATITRQVFSGTGSQTVFTLASDPGAVGNSAQVYIGGVYQQRSTYTIAGTTLTFSAAPVAGTNNIEFVNFLTSTIGTTSADLVTYTPAGSGAVARSAASKMGDVVSVRDFGAVGDGVADDTAAIQAASLAVSNAGSGTLYIPKGTYKYTRLTIRSGVIFRGDGAQSTFLVCTDPTSLDAGIAIGSSIRKLDDGTRARRSGFCGIFFSTGAAGTGANQATYANVIGINLCACEQTIIEDCAFAGFGQGALVFARAENGTEGLGFANTNQDGNYNHVANVSVAACGAYNAATSAIWFLYKANSNKLYSIFIKGITGAYGYGFAYGNDNAIVGGTVETAIGVANIGYTATAVSGNVFISIRAESVTGDAYVFGAQASNNAVFGGYHTGVSGQDFNLAANSKNRVLSDNTNWLRNVNFPPPSSYSTLHNFGAVAVTSLNGSPTYPLYVKSPDYNTVGSYPYVLLYNDIAGGAVSNVLGRIGWHTSDTTAGAAGVSVAIDAILEDSSGGSGLAISTGTGTTLAERVRVTNTGVFRPSTDNTQSLGTAAFRWSEVFAGAPAINTSDGRSKVDTALLSDAERRVAQSIKGLVKKFRYADAVAKKGDDARIHVGVVAQDVIAAFMAEGLDPMRYGIVCYDEWPEEVDESGIVIVEAGNRYGVRYTELLAFIIAAI